MRETKPMPYFPCEADARDRRVPSLPYSITSSLSSKGQGVIEYTILIAILVAVLVGMASYVQRALAGKWRDVGDTFGYGRQYEPGVTAVTTVRQ